MDSTSIFILAFWVLWSILCAVVASNKGRNPWRWAGLGLLFGVFAFIVLLFMKNLSATPVSSTFGGATGGMVGESVPMKSCLHCMSAIPAQATVCRVCSRDT